MNPAYKTLKDSNKTISYSNTSVPSETQTKRTFEETNSASSTLPLYKKYILNSTQEQEWLDPDAHLTPEDLLAKPFLNINPHNYPYIKKHYNLLDNNFQNFCNVSIDSPIFFPSPKILLFTNYEPYVAVTKKLYFRNQDTSARRIRVIPPESPFFKVTPPLNPDGSPLPHSKIAGGMEVMIQVTFLPQEINDYEWDLQIVTEREEFIVPIRALGHRPKLILPQSIDFGACPIKSMSSTKILIKNDGEIDAKITLKSNLNKIFICPEHEILIPSNSFLPLELNFMPIDTNPINDELIVEIISSGSADGSSSTMNKIKAYIAIKGVGKNIEVSLSSPSVTVEPSYISLFSQKVVKIRNLSDQKINFQWKSFLNSNEEEIERDRLLNEINRIENEERNDLLTKVKNGYYDNLNEAENQEYLKLKNNNDEDFLTNDMTEYVDNISFANLPYQARIDEAILVRKFRNLRKALEVDKMLFVDDIFELSPLEGEIWPNSDIEVNVIFRPDSAANYSCLSFLDVIGRVDRLPLQLNGQGIGPNAQLSFEVLDLGDVFVNDKTEYELEIKNKGDIPAQWTFMSSLTKFSSKFQFFPLDGYLLPNKSQKIKITFESDILGEFNEYFRFALQGNEDMLICQIKGHIIGPTFHFDRTCLDFKTVSFDCYHSEKVILTNTSKIMMVYNLHIPQDGVYLNKEFNIVPSRGTLNPKESIEVLIEFIPNSVKKYEYSLAIDVLGVGDILLSIPILAECIISSVKFELDTNRELNFYDCFIRYPYEQDLKLINLSDVVHTKFEILPQPKHTISVVSYEVIPSVAVIEPGDFINLKVRLIGKKLGEYKVPLIVSIAGSQEPPLQCILHFNVIGPKIELSVNELKWGNILCLKNYQKSLILKNSSLIPASIKLFLKMAKSCYSLNIQNLVLNPEEEYDLEVIANLDDNILTKDELHFIVEEGDNLMIPLLAKGIGTTLYCEENLETLDLGVRLSNIWIEKQIVIENKGRRIQQLKWTNKTITTENQNRLAKAKKLNKDPNYAGKLPKHLAPLEPYFTIHPEEITLRPRTATVFTLKGFSSTPKFLNEVFILESKIGKDRHMKQILESSVICQVVNPLLHFSSNELFFEYVWEKNIPILIQKKEVTLTNSSDLTLSFTLKCEVPFYVNIYDLILEPGASSTIEISFDPAYKGDFQSHLVESNLEIIYRGHPQKDVIKLQGNIVFPNLDFDSTSINFGSLLNNTSKNIKVRLTNPTKIDVKYQWIFMENSTQPSNNSRAKSRNGPVVVTPPSHIFDILPINSVIPPHNNEIVEFTMLSTMNFKLSSMVVCQVEGGPEYKFPIMGETSDVSYELDTSVLDFGRVDFLQRMDKDINIKNTGRVPFNYTIKPLSDYDEQFLEFLPPEGKINGNSTGKVTIRMKPGVPDNIKASFLLSIAHFDPVQIDCYCQGIFPVLSIGLNRYHKIGPLGELENVTSSQWEEFQSQAISQIISPNPKLLPPPIYPNPASGSTANVPEYIPIVSNIVNLSDSILPPGPPLMENDELESVSLSLASSTKGLPLHQIDSEMQRLTLSNLIKNKVEEVKEKFNTDPSQLVAVNNEVQTNVSSSSVSPSKTTKKVIDNNPDQLPVILQDLVLKYVQLKELVTARYVCDFGNIILGQTKKKIFKITNNSLCGALSWTFDKKYLSNTGFSIEPEKVLKLTEGSTVEFSVKYFAKTQQKLGLKQVLLPLEISENGPVLHIVFIVNVCLPELELSESKLDFGKVLLGTSVKKYITLFNPTPVVANWSLRRGGLIGQSTSSSKGKEENKVLISPSSGSLRPNKRVVIEVEYLPVDNAPLKTNFDYALRVDLNKKNKIFTVLGENLLLPLSFDTNQVTIPPALPFSNGTETIIKVTNTNLKYPLEFFSIDFDNQFKEEEKMLECLDYDELGYYRTDLRVPGQGIPFQVKKNYEEYQKKLEALKLEESKSENKEEGGEDNQEKSVEESPIIDENKIDEIIDPSNVFYPPPIRKFLLPSESEKPTPSYRDQNKIQDFLILGPRFSGVTTLVNNIKKKLAISSFTIDKLIEDVSNCDDPIYGILARRITGRLTPEEQEAIDAKLAISSQAVEQAKIAAEEAYKKEKKGKMKGDFPPEIYNTPELAAHNKLLEEMELNSSNVSLLWNFRLQWEDMGDGIIIDGSEWSKYLPMDVIINSLYIALPHIFIINLSIPRDEDGYYEWVGHIQSIAQVEMERLKRAIESNSKQLTKFFKPTKSKTLDQFKAEVKNSVNNKFFPAGIPTGEESWIDQNNGRVCELESNDFKSLEDKDKITYLMQVLNQQFMDLDKVTESYTKIYQALNPTSQTNSELQEGEEVPANVESHQIEENKVENNYINYNNIISTLLSTLPKYQLENTTKHDSTKDKEVEITDIQESQSDDQPKSEENSQEKSDEKSPDESDEKAGESVNKLNSGGVIDILIEGDESIDTILSLALAQLPPPFISAYEKENVIPQTKYFQLYNKSFHRPNRRPIKNFRLVHLDDELNPVEPEPEPEIIPEPVTKGKKPLSAKSKAAAAAAEAEALAQKEREKELERARLEALKNRPPPTRWVIPPGETIELKIRFSSEKEASYNCNMEFEVVGTAQRFTIPCSSICEYPKINLDTRNLFMKRLKAITPSNPYPIRRFVIAENFYSFGPLPLFKKANWIPKYSNPDELLQLSDDDKLLFESIKETHSDIIRISNNGLYKAKVKLDWVYPEGSLPSPPPPLSAKPNAAELAAKANYEQALIASKIFSCEEYEFEIEEGDTKEVRIWALPTLEKEYNAVLSLSVADNPAVTNFDVKCWGGNANLKTSGPWSIAIQEAEKALANNTDKKAAKELEAKLNSLKESMLIDFNRVLICKKEKRSFTIENPGCVPIAWRIIPQDFENSNEITFSPTHGILTNNQVGEVEVYFTCQDEKLLEGKFALEYGDAEGCIPEIAQKVAREQADAAAAAAKAAAEASGNKFSRTLAKTLQGSAFTSPTLPFVPTVILPPHLGGQRVNYFNFKVSAEAYGIHAVSLTQAGKEVELNATGTFDPELTMKKRKKEKNGPASELDFGLVRVGDFAIQTLKMGNKGKYKIAYNFKFLNEKMKDFVTITPMEGTIESAIAAPVDPKAAKAAAKGKNEPQVDPSSAEIQVTFCSKESSSVFDCNSDILIQILEPLTGEIVEEFPLLITAKAIFSSFRVQPSRGLQFGAIRYDGAQRSKKIEVRNDSEFEWVVFACPTQNEVEEFDLIDDNLFSALSYACPPALRTHELGEGYKSKAWTVDGPPNTNAKGGKAPPKASKGKGKDAGPSEKIIQFTTLNPLVQDIDRLACPPLILDPLVVGAFTIHPQLSVVQPGQFITIECKFDPAAVDFTGVKGSGTSSSWRSAKENIRLWISGSDPNDGFTKSLRSFELVGESCLPAIVTNEWNEIFEEQQVVSSLSELTDKVGHSSYAIAENTLTFGHIPCVISGVSAPNSSRGKSERIKIINPTKIDIKVSFKLMTQAAASTYIASKSAPAPTTDKKGKPAPPKSAGKGGKGGKGEVVEETVTPFFTTYPEVWEIPPHEHRFVTINFSPAEIKKYDAVFIAEIEDSNGSIMTLEMNNNNKTLTLESKDNTVPEQAVGSFLNFNLTGSGTLPLISLAYPTEKSPDGGKFLLNFPKTLVGKKSKKKIIVRNDGILPATCLFEFSPTHDFSFPLQGSSLTVQPGSEEPVYVEFKPTESSLSQKNISCQLKIIVLNNVYSSYNVLMTGEVYSCDATFHVPTPIASDEFSSEINDDSTVLTATTNANPIDDISDHLELPDLNLLSNDSSSSSIVYLQSNCEFPLKFELVRGEELSQKITFSPSLGHLAPRSKKEITITLSNLDTPIEIVKKQIICNLQRISYPSEHTNDESLRGYWDDSMKSIRPAVPEDLKQIQAYNDALADYNKKVEAEAKKGKKAKPVGPPPSRCLLELVPSSSPNQQQMVYEVVAEPTSTILTDYPQQQSYLTVSATADTPTFTSTLEKNDSLKFNPTYLFQTSSHKFTVKNTSKIKLPIKFFFDNLNKKVISRASMTSEASRLTMTSPSGQLMPQCPFKIDPEEIKLNPNESKEITLSFSPLDAGDFLYSIRGIAFPSPSLLPILVNSVLVPDAKVSSTITSPRPTTSSIQAVNPSTLKDLSQGEITYTVLHGPARRPIIHFDMVETLDYLSRREPNLKNEFGIASSIETTDLKIVELESVGLKTRNVYRFFITNTTNESYEFVWESQGEPSPAWRCVQTAGMLFPGKRVEIIFEYIPDDVNVAEAFFKFTAAKVGISQMFLFTGRVKEPKVSFSTSKLDFHSVMLGGEGNTEVIYLENHEHLPFQFSFDKFSLMQLEGPLSVQGKNGVVENRIVNIFPLEGTVPAHGKIAITMTFLPHEEVVYNFNLICHVKRKPNKLSINLKGEGYSVHPIVQLEQPWIPEIQGSSNRPSSPTTLNDPLAQKYIQLKPLPATNIADFGAVQVLDSLTKAITVANAGKYNFDYSWNIEKIGSMLTLTGGKLNGTLLKGEQMEYKLTFAPMREGNLDNSRIKFTVAGKYTYEIIPKGLAVKPALRFSFMQYDFGNCFITSPGGSTVVEETILLLKNHDPEANITVECVFPKMRALWIDCPPTVLAPNQELPVKISFAPREVKEYSFAVPFLVNGSGKVNVNIHGKGINARLELVNGAQRKTNFGLVNVNGSSSRQVMIINKSKKALPISLKEGGEFESNLKDKDITFSPNKQVILAPKETLPIDIFFKPTKRVSQFTEDLFVEYAGLHRVLLSLSGKAQGLEASLDTDCIPFGKVVLDSKKVKKLTLENVGDLTISFQWDKETFGQHFSITPLSGKLFPGNEIIFDVTFRPKFEDSDIRQDNLKLHIVGMDNPLLLSCSGQCIKTPTENVETLTFHSSTRKNEIKTVKLTNPTDKDWYVSPSLQGVDWKVPFEFKIPAKGSGDMPVTYFPLTMTSASSDSAENNEHKGKLFIALPDGSARLYELRGTSSPPESSGKITLTVPAKKSEVIPLSISNWLGESQKFDVTVTTKKSPSPATFFVAANTTEVGPNGTKEFPVRFVSYCEGLSEAIITFTNPNTHEYCFFNIEVQTTMSEILETYTVEAPVRQSARAIISIENPLGSTNEINMGSVSKPTEWWTSDSKFIRVRELSPLSGRSEGAFEVEFRPLTVQANPSEHLVTIITQELGTFKYKIIAKSTNSLLKNFLKFETSLGTKQKENFKFKVFNTSKTEFSCKITPLPGIVSTNNDAVFTVQNSLVLDPIQNSWDGEEILLPIVYEPTSLGTQKFLLTLSSNEGGIYTCELEGNCTPPLPQGPYEIEQGSLPYEIVFRNCFNSTTQWTISLDSSSQESFRITTPTSVTLNAKAEGKLSIVFEPPITVSETMADGAYINTKLFLSCTNYPSLPPWVYYLRGKINKSAPPPKGKK